MDVVQRAQETRAAINAVTSLTYTIQARGQHTESWKSIKHRVTLTTLHPLSAVFPTLVKQVTCCR
jgi:hypothetical protein